MKRTVGLIALIWLFALAAGAAAATPTTAGHQAGLVIFHPDESVTISLVTFDQESISGIELLRSSGVDVVTVDFGGLGDGVCSIEGDGCGVAPCRQRLCQTGDPDAPFWQFFSSGSDGWAVMPLGASAARVQDGDVFAWSWSSGPLDSTTYSLGEIQERLGADDLTGTARSQRFDGTGTLIALNATPDTQADWVAMTLMVGIVAGAVVIVVRKRFLA